MRKTNYFNANRAKEDAQRLIDLMRSLLTVSDNNYNYLYGTNDFIAKVREEIKDYFIAFREDLAETAIIADDDTYFELDSDGTTVVAIHEEHIDGIWVRTYEPINIELYI